MQVIGFYSISRGAVDVITKRLGGELYRITKRDSALMGARKFVAARNLGWQGTPAGPCYLKCPPLILKF